MVQAGVLLQYVVLSGDDGSGAPDSVETCKNSGICYSLQSVFTSMREEFLSATSEILVVVYLSAAAHVTPSGIVLEIPPGMANNVDLALVGDGPDTYINWSHVGHSSGGCGGLVLNGFSAVEMTNLTFSGGELVLIDFNAVNMVDLTFTGCYGGNSQVPVVSMRSGATVNVSSCRFIGNEGMAIEVENIDSVTISNCLFSGSKDHPSGGIRIKYTDESTAAAKVLIKLCQFLYLNSTIVSQIDDHTGYGAGIGIFINKPSFPMTIAVVSSQFEGNVAFSGAGIYTRVRALPQNSLILIYNCTFIGCSAQDVDSERHVLVREGGQGGAMGILFSRESRGNLSILSSTFHANHAVGGAGVSVFYAERSTQVHIKIEGSRFTHNVGKNSGALALNNIMAQGDWPQPVQCLSTWFADNVITGKGKGSAIVTVYVDFALRNNTEIRTNNGTAVWVFGGSWLYVAGLVKFIGNTGYSGSAISLHKDSALHVHQGTTLLFLNNSALNRGGALHVSNSAASLAELVLGGPNVQNNRCFIVPNRDDRIESLQTNVLNATIVFADNTAKAGGAIHAYSLDVCAWEKDEMKLDFRTVLHSSSFYYHNNRPQNISSEIASIDVYLAITVDHTTESSLKHVDVLCSDDHTTYCIIPGISYEIYVKGKDTVGQEASGTVELFSEHLGMVSFHALLQKTQLTHTLPTVADSGWKHIYFSGVQNQTEEIAISTEAIPVFTRVIRVRLIDCPVGYKYNEQYKTCLCDSGKHTHILECRYDGGVRAEPGYWVGRIAPGRPHASYSCPDGYCQCPNGSCWFDSRVQPDQQCAKGRNGTLCGECIDGYSATFGSLQTQCVANCTEEYKWELPIFIVVSILIVLAAVKINLDVASGVLRSFVLYFQIVGFTLNAIPPNGILYYAWVKYLVEIPNFNIRVDVCMWDGMTSLQSTALQYVIPACIFICMALFIIMARKFARISRIPVLRPFWSLITLTYVSIAYTTLRLLQCVPLEDGDDYYWYGDGNVRCFTEAHTPYAILAIIIAAVYVIPFPFFVVVLPSCSRMNPVSDIILKAFKREKFWWGEGWNFAQRLIIVLIHCFSNSPSLHQTLVIFAVVVFLTLHAQLQPYSLPHHNLLQTCLLFNLLVVNTLQVYSVSDSPIPYPVTQTVFLLPYAASCIWFVYFLWKKHKDSQRKKKQKERPQDVSFVPHEPADINTLPREVSKPVEMTDRSTGSHDTSSLPRSYESDPLMDESRNTLREPLLTESFNSQC